MLGGHLWELVIVLALALVVFGPKRLPEIGGAMGKGIKEFKKGTSDLMEAGSNGAGSHDSTPLLQPVPVAAEHEAVPSIHPSRFSEAAAPGSETGHSVSA